MHFKNLITAVACFGVLGFSTSAFAAHDGHHIGLEGRADYQSIDNDFSKSGKRGDSKFLAKTARVNFSGPTGVEDQSYVLTINLAKSNTLDNTKTSSMIESFYVKQGLAHGFSLFAGKVFAYHGSNEWWYSGADIYTYSSFGYSSEVWAEGYDMGAELNYSGHGQWLALQVLNPHDAKSGISNRHSYTLSYRGNLMNGMIVPSLSYGAFADNGTSATGNTIAATDKHLGVGVQFNHSMVAVQLDYHSSKEEFQGTGGKDVEGSSMVALVRYNHDHFRPFVKYISEEAEDKGTGADKVEKTAFDIGLEWYPNKDSQSRWHIAYSSEDYDCKSGSAGTTCTVNEKVSTAVADHTATTIRAGFKFMVDVL